MIIKLIETKDGNSSPIHELFIDGKRSAYIQDLYDCAEDAHIGRDLIDGHDIIGYIQMGYNAAKNGEELVFE